MPDPPNTPIDPANPSGVCADDSSASQAHSMKCRCCGSITAASRLPMPKNSGSNWSTPSIRPLRSTYSGEPTVAAGTPSRIRSDGSRSVRQSSPRPIRSHNTSTSRAPGKWPAIPMIATSVSASWSGSIGDVSFTCWASAIPVLLLTYEPRRASARRLMAPRSTPVGAPSPGGPSPLTRLPSPSCRPTRERWAANVRIVG